MAANDIFIYTNATSVANAVITSNTVTTAASFPDLVLGDSPTYNFRFTDGAAAVSWAGNAQYSIEWALGTSGADDSVVLAYQTQATAITGGWTMVLPLNTGAILSQLNSARISQEYPVVRLWQQIRVTDPSGYKTTYATIRTNLRLRTVPNAQPVPDDPLPAGYLNVLAAQTGALASPATFFSASGAAVTSVRWTSIETWGAVADGTTDARAAIQAACDYIAGRGGGVVFVPPGTYAVSKNPTTASAVLLDDNTMLMGCGKGVSVIKYTDANTTPSSCINTSSGAGNASQAVQDVGNENINVVDLTVRFVNSVEAKGNGISFAGVTGGSISRVGVQGAGGYSIYLIRNNDKTGQDVEGKVTERVTVSDFEITGFLDVGLEFSGAVDCVATNGIIRGPGAIGGSGVGGALYVWNGSQNCALSNISIYGDGASNKVRAVGFDDYSGSNTAVRRTSKITFSNIIAQNVWGGVYTNSPTLFGDVAFRGVLCYGYDSPTSYGVRLNYVKNLSFTDCAFERFNYTLAVSTPAITANQRNSEHLEFSRTRFVSYDGGVGAEIYGVTGLRLSNNYFKEGYSYGVKLFGCQDVNASDNRGHNIGQTGVGAGNAPLLLFVKNDGSDTRESLNITANGNRIYDDRATKWTYRCVLFGDASDGIVAIGNNARGGKSGSPAATNVGSGTNVTIANNLDN